MSQPFQVSAEKALLIPDVHCDLGFVNKILEIERGNYDHIIFLGDLFDSHKRHPEVAGTKETAKFVKKLCEGEYGPVTICLGNHDLPYFESWKVNQAYSKNKHLINSCSGNTNSKSLQINKILDISHWNKFQLFCECHGWLISHAGFHPSYFDTELSREDNLISLWEESKVALSNIFYKPHRLFACGVSRGGWNAVGGCCWLDFTDEFQESDLVGKQLVGHTGQNNNVRLKGKSYCFDGKQTTYAILTKDNIAFKTVDSSGKFEIGEESTWKYTGWL